MQRAVGGPLRQGSANRIFSSQHVVASDSGDCVTGRVSIPSTAPGADPASEPVRGCPTTRCLARRGTLPGPNGGPIAIWGALPKIGHRPWYVASWNGEWLAMLSFSAAAWKCTARDAWIGWGYRRHDHSAPGAQRTPGLRRPAHDRRLSLPSSRRTPPSAWPATASRSIDT
jgi:hypothetical protein